ncbi:MAG TPA: glycogen/starch/alpha-glucan phosphorylase [Candidatus Borkfalkia faecigallinarum]|uniref:Alpha-1,4 glucan phosphorylase n=1 Tax=Candidatus Borkfalkia faecigallinarum TaxID=2838509 RepID=A0A9D1VT99_9FIRM|nr:glycogen/starch/alpha-glucan phosphorylase [Candidatus Borkfalkia faecigallinarum]
MSSTKSITEKEVQALIQGKLSRYFGVSPKEATTDQIYKAVVMSVRDILLEKRQQFHKVMKSKKGKRVYYLCMEFLLGRSLKNNIYNLGLGDAYSKALKYFNLTLDDLYEQEPDAGLGNGGLGRLAACFMDALATGNYPAMGYSIRYDYGLFKQKIVDGWQTELPDIWLPGGEVWLTQRSDKSCTVKFDGWVKEDWTENGLKVTYGGYKEVEAVAYDMMISGKDSDAVSVLRLWRARNISHFDMKLFSQGDYLRCMQEENEAEVISKVLYPADDHYEGKSLRLKQQYFLVSASLQNIINDHKHRYGPLSLLPQQAAIHINDTHPALAIPELMRLLMDENGFTWDDAWNIVTSTFAYTNHTVMAEALETWQEDLIARRLPRIHMILKEINRRFCNDLWARFPGQHQFIERMSVISNGQVRMANLSVIGSHKVNGVSALHSDIIKNSIFNGFYQIWPEKFTNVTNGIAHRRWLCQSNPELCGLLNDCIGDGYVKDAMQLSKFKKFADDESVLKRLNEIKQIKKKQFADYAFKKEGVVIDPNSVFDVQAKRMHEYKRQLLNTMNIIALYADLLDDPDKDIQPQTFIFGAKAAPGYLRAKQFIKLICYLAEDIKKHPKIREKLNVVYMEDYNVTMAEKMIPATEVSEQISLAGKEASGTGNMKFMINGALTIGTLDGANVEMSETVGQDNIFIFGLRADEVEEMWSKGYNASLQYNQNPLIRRIVEMLLRGFNGESFSEIANYLLTGTPVADPYMCMADFESYHQTQNKVKELYRTDKKLWSKISLNNIASAGIFAADRSIKEYADNIWHLKPLKA